MSLEDLIIKAELAEQLEHYKEMKELMYNFVKIKSKDSKTNKKHILTEDERNLLSVAYKNLVGEKRNAWRLLCALERTGSDNDRKQEIVRETREKTESDVHALCQEINDLLEKYLLPSETGDNQSPEETESTVFYHKMKADYFRYRVEVSKPEERSELTEKAASSYTHAIKLAESLPATNAVKLGLALNFSVFHFEIKNDSAEAVSLAQKAFYGAIEDLDALDEDKYKASSVILQLLRDNMAIWTDEENE